MDAHLKNCCRLVLADDQQSRRKKQAAYQLLGGKWEKYTQPLPDRELSEYRAMITAQVCNGDCCK